MVALAAAAFKRPLFFTDPITMDRMLKSQGVLLNKAWYGANSMAKAIEKNIFTVPHSRRKLTKTEMAHILNLRNRVKKTPALLQRARRLAAFAAQVMKRGHDAREAAILQLKNEPHITVKKRTTKSGNLRYVVEDPRARQLELTFIIAEKNREMHIAQLAHANDYVILVREPRELVLQIYGGQGFGSSWPTGMLHAIENGVKSRYLKKVRKEYLP